MIVATIKETQDGETRVALSPTVAAALARVKLSVMVESGAGAAAGFDDAAFVARGATVASRADVLAAADILVQVRIPLDPATLAAVKPKALLAGFCDPLGNPGPTERAAAAGVSIISMELVPRIARAQALDALSSQANIAGYKAVIIAAGACPKIFPMMMTAAGTLQACRVFIIGAGVAGLQAIATARRLGAIVSAFDVRSAAREQVQSVGAKFVELPMDSGNGEAAGGYAKALSLEQQQKQAELLARVVADSDVVISTALVPGKPAPKLITAAAVAKMRPGSVIVDLAAERGGNCELTVPDQTVVRNGVTIVGNTNIPATVPQHASIAYANNISKLLMMLVNKEGQLTIDTSDEVIAGCLVVHGGAVVHPRVKELLAPVAVAVASGIPA
jgi:NAD(P) transhydrogenase subunit alpha